MQYNPTMVMKEYREKIYKLHKLSTSENFIN